MNFKINGIDASIEVTSTGLVKLAIPSQGMFITERAASTSDADIEKASIKIMLRAKSLMWEFPEPKGVK
jgi:hypothetical protein